MKSKSWFNKLEKAIKSCRKCPGLNIPKVTMSAIGHGKITGRPIMMIGQSLHTYNPETPKKQLPFVGPKNVHDSGDVLFAVIEKAGLKSSDIYITNAVKCHPPGNRTSTSQETRNCKKFLRKEIEMIQPRLIIALGRGAQKSTCNVLGFNKNIERGRIESLFNSKRSIDFVWVYHPAYILYRSGFKKQGKWLSEMEEMLDEYSSL